MFTRLITAVAVATTSVLALCAPAAATTPAPPKAGSLTGLVYVDRNRNRRFDHGDTLLANHDLAIYMYSKGKVKFLRRALTNKAGTYLAAGVVTTSGDYTVGTAYGTRISTISMNAAVGTTTRMDIGVTL